VCGIVSNEMRLMLAALVAWQVVSSDMVTNASGKGNLMNSEYVRDNFEALVGTSSGCPLAFLWTSVSGYPSGVVDGGEESGHVKFSGLTFCSASEFDAIAELVLQMFEDGEIEAPKANRLAFHSSALYSAAAGRSGLGGPNGGWFRLEANKNFKGNAGLPETVDVLLRLIEEKYPCITFADLVTFTGAILTEAAGGPAIAWMAGRMDALHTPSNPPLAARLPDASFSIAAVNYFYTQIGLTEREIVALNSGGHSFGAADLTASGWNGSFTSAADVWPTPKNKYLVDTFAYQWEPQVVSSEIGTRIQYVLADGQGVDPFTEEGSHIIRLPSDVAILTQGGNLTAWAYEYSQNETLFLADFARIMQRVSQLGAGESWSIDESYVWLGMNGTATNYGTSISPQDGIPISSVNDGMEVLIGKN